VRGRYPVRVVHFTSIECVQETMKQTRVLDDYWHVDGGMIGACGHRHSTKEKADECIPAMAARHREATWRACLIPRDYMADANELVANRRARQRAGV